MTSVSNNTSSRIQNYTSENKAKFENTVMTLDEHFQIIDNADAWPHSRNDGEIHRNDLKAIIDNPGKYPKEVVEAAKYIYNNASAFSKLDAADGTVDNIIKRSAVKTFMDRFEAEAQAKGTPTPQATRPGVQGTVSPNSRDAYPKTGNSQTGQIAPAHQVKTPTLTRIPVEYKGTSGLASLKADWKNAANETNDLWAKYRGIKEGAHNPETGKPYSKDEAKAAKQELMHEIQAAQQWQSQLNQFLTNMLKMQHENTMAVIRNIR